jgi:ferrous iron transport protein A
LDISIANLKVGEQGVIKDISLENIPLSLLEMGCLPGEDVELLQVAPLSDPLYIRVNGSHLAIRKETASQILITKK